MYLKICLLILLLLPAAQKGRKAPVLGVAGQWQIDTVRSVNERRKDLVFTFRLKRNRVTWIQEYTKEGAIERWEHDYFLGKKTWKELDIRYETHVEFDENQLIIRQRSSSPSMPLPNWDVYEFEVKDHGYTLYHKHTIGRDVAVYANVRYFRPVPKKKK